MTNLGLIIVFVSVGFFLIGLMAGALIYVADNKKLRLRVVELENALPE